MSNPLLDEMPWCDSGDELKEYPKREIYAFGRYIMCQILNWDDGPPPRFLVCNPLDPAYHEEFLAAQGMGIWMRVDLREALRMMATSLPSRDRA